MKAITVNRFGGPEVLELSELPAPTPGEHEVAIEVAAAGVHWLDTQIRSGNAPEFFPTTPPYVPGSGVVGTVVAAGPGVDGDWVGGRVVARASAGGYAERVTAKQELVFAVPDALDPYEALALLNDGSTAIGLLEKTPVHEGEWVLVQPALGGLGSLLIQLAGAAGARVLGAARGEHKLAMARELGAEVTVDYSTPQWLDQVRAATGGTGVQVVFDGVSGETGTQALSVLADGGRFSTYGVAGGAPVTVDERAITSVGMEQLGELEANGEPRRRITGVLDLAAAGELRAVIGQTYPLADAAKAHADFADRTILGKTILLC